MHPAFRFLLVLTACMLWIAHPGGAALLYSEGFDSPDVGSGDGAPLGDYNWATHRGGNGGIAINGNPGWPPANPVSGSSSAQARVVDDAAAPSASNRVFLFWNFDADEDYLSWTSNFTAISLGSYSSLSLSFYHRNTNGSGGASEPGTRAAVGISTGNGTRWFATGTRNTNVTANWTQVTANLLGSDWVEFTFNGTQSADATAGFDVTGSSGSLPAGSLVALGVYSELEASGSSGDAVRFDSVVLDGIAIPEPSCAALLTAALVPLLTRRRAALRSRPV